MARKPKTATSSSLNNDTMTKLRRFGGASSKNTPSGIDVLSVASAASRLISAASIAELSGRATPVPPDREALVDEQLHERVIHALARRDHLRNERPPRRRLRHRAGLVLRAAHGVVVPRLR